MFRIGLALSAAVALAALSPLIGGAGRASDAVAVAGLVHPDRPESATRPAEAAVLEGCLGQKGARQAARCIGHVADACLKRAEASGADAQSECYRREADAWSGLVEHYRGRLEQRLFSDGRKLAELRDGQTAWVAERAKRCDGASDAGACTMKENGRRALQLRLLAEHAGAAL